MTINNTALERVSNFNFLGLLISSNTKWNCHIDHVYRKVSRTVGVLNTFPSSILITLYNSIVLPHFNYCLVVWGSSTNVTKLYTLQKKFLRIAKCSSSLAHTEPIFKHLNLLKIEYIYKFRVLKFYFNLVRGDLPSTFHMFSPKQYVGSTCYAMRN